MIIRNIKNREREIFFFIVICFLLNMKFLSIVYAESFPVSKESFQKTVQHLHTTYLVKMTFMTTQTNNDLEQMEKSLHSIIRNMLIFNQRSLERTAFQLNREMPSSLMREMKQLNNEVLDMQKRLTIQFNQ
jgi:hypothetical protein